MAKKRDFTDRFLKSLKPAESGKRYIEYDAQVPHFGIRVSDRCTDECKGAFVLVTRFPGSDNPTARRIDEYPGMALGKAREIAREWLDDIRQGIDPKIKAEELRRQEERKRADSFSATFESFAEDHLSTLRSGVAVKAAISTHVVPQWGDRPISAIRRADANELIRMLKKDMPIGINRIVAYLKKFGGWLVDQDILEASPFAAVKRPTKETKRDRVLSDIELCAIWEACGELGAFGRAFRFMLATGQRRTEVGAMTWAELDRKQALWTLPRGRTKANRGHEVPLSALALSIIEECPKIGDFVFSTGRSGPLRAGGNGEPRPISGWGKAKAKLDTLALQRLRALAEERGEEPPAEFAEWHLHDLRRTCATNLARLGVDRITISKILNHSEGGVTAIYDRHRYDAEKRRALDLWAQRLAAIVAGDDTGGNVVTLTGRPLANGQT
jgi:integrase